VSVGQLILEPTTRGYEGTAPITVTYHGTEPASYSFQLEEGIAGSFQGITPEDACVWNYNADLHRSIFCSVPGGALQPGESRAFAMRFRVLTTTQKYAMSAAGGTVNAIDEDGAVASATKKFSAVFRSTKGSIKKPRL
jgi:hypothetical protein